MCRNSEVLAYMGRPFASVLDVPGKTPLPGVQIDGGYRVPRFNQRDCYMNCNRRFALAALFRWRRQ